MRRNNVMHYVYELAYPESMGGAVFYVGEGQGSRIHAHESEARIVRRRGEWVSQKCQIIRKIWDHGEQVVKRKVFETFVAEDAFIYEWVLIHLIYGHENLTNVNEGGEGRGSTMPRLAKRSTGFTLSEDIVDDIWRYAGNLSQKKRDKLPSYLQDTEALCYFRENIFPEINLRAWRKARRQCIVRVYLDIYDYIDAIPIDIRSPFVEFCLRKELEIFLNSPKSLLTIK